MSGPSRDSGGMMSEINVTPFVDVMLVLLIIFMVTAPMMSTGVEMELPRADAPPLANTEEQLVLSIDADQKYYIGDTAYPFEELPTKLRALADSKPDQQVFVRADGTLPYELVLQLLAVAKNAGIPKVGLVTQPGPPPAAPSGAGKR
jgi:biopolymer transport protein TolR